VGPRVGLDAFKKTEILPLPGTEPGYSSPQPSDYIWVLISLRLFLFPILLFAAQPKEFFLDGLKKLEQRSLSVWRSGGGYVE
jgi:hypothetical protein